MLKPLSFDLIGLVTISGPTKSCKSQLAEYLIKEHKFMVSSLKRGAEVITSGGMVGKIEKVHDDDKLDLKISENVTVKIIKSTVQSLLTNPNTKK